MPFETFNPPVRQSPGTKVTPEVKVLTADFGDGYTQESPDGSNNVKEVATLQWNVLLEEDAQAIYDFFVGKKGSTPFYYALTGNAAKKWTCKVFDREWETPNKVTATFKESFVHDPG